MKKKPKAEIVPKQAEVARPVENNPQSMIMQAIDKNAPIETLERLFNLQERWEKSQAKKQYDLAMSAFQADVPSIPKSKIILDKDRVTVRSKYAALDDIQNAIKAPLKNNGLSYNFDVKIDEKFLTVECIIKHFSGHSERSSFAVPIGNETYMSDAQKYGARTTFAKRYALGNALGLTIDEDVDGRSFEGENSTEKILSNIDKCMNLGDLKRTWDSLPKESQSNSEVLGRFKQVKALILDAQKNENL